MKIELEIIEKYLENKNWILNISDRSVGTLPPSPTPQGPPILVGLEVGGWVVIVVVLCWFLVGYKAVSGREAPSYRPFIIDVLGRFLRVDSMYR